MAKDEKELMDLIVKYTSGKGGAKGTWYVGVSKDPKKQLFNVHQVVKDKDYWVYDYGVDPQEIGRLMDKLLMMGFDGETKTTYDGMGVYVYQKRQHTKE